MLYACEAAVALGAHSGVLRGAGSELWLRRGTSYRCGATMARIWEGQYEEPRGAVLEENLEAGAYIVTWRLALDVKYKVVSVDEVKNIT
uniref:Uncharacterized protein n=1 Tax=Ascaris lumbricoides TaxID=6252 RepID=A0A0M3HRU9_ASCLU